MGQQRGTYCWDDDSLTPGKGSRGGWSQNLFDEDGNLREHARFIPDPDSDDENSDSHPYNESETFVSTEKRRQTAGSDDPEYENYSDDFLNKALVALVGAAVIAGVVYVAPRVKKWVDKTALPFIKDKLSKRHIMRSKEADAEITPENDQNNNYPTALSKQQLPCLTDVPFQIPEKRQRMSNEEAQARLIAAAAARLFAEEQLELISRSEIVDVTNIEALQKQLAEFPHEMLEALLQHLSRNPRLLEDGSLAQIGFILKKQSVGIKNDQAIVPSSIESQSSTKQTFSRQVSMDEQ